MKTPLLILNLAGAAVLAWVVTDTALRVDSYVRDQAGLTPAEAVMLPGRSGGPTADVEAIVAAHLFGQPGREVQPVVQAPVPKTRLQLVLTGVVAARDPQLARAIIASGPAPARSYRVGDLIAQTDATVDEIRGDMVLLSRGGKQESLTLVRAELNSPVARPNASAEDLANLPQPSDSLPAMFPPSPPESQETLLPEGASEPPVEEAPDQGQEQEQPQGQAEGGVDARASG